MHTVPHLHLSFIEADGSGIVICVPDAEAQYYTEKYAADGSTLEGAAHCRDPRCTLRARIDQIEERRLADEAVAYGIKRAIAFLEGLQFE